MLLLASLPRALPVVLSLAMQPATATQSFLPRSKAVVSPDSARVLKSATANAENNHNLSAQDLIVLDAVADEGPMIKRWRPRAQGRAFPIHKAMTHITIVVADQEA